MSVEAWTITPEYTIAGTGPYAISHPYVEGAIRAYVQLPTGRLELNTSEFAVSPAASDTTGNLTLSPTAAATHAGLALIIDRITPDEQGWVAVLGEREEGLAAQLDRMVQSIQELRARGAGALRVRVDLDPFDWQDGTVPILEDGKVKSGPTADAIAEAQARASEAAASAAAAADSAAEALAKENSMLRDRGDWATALLYSPSDIVTINGSAYICILSHFATVFATDLAASRWRLFAAKGDAGPGTGDMLKTENLSGLTNIPQARTNMGLGALATKTLAAFADIDPSAVITDTETLAANKVANAIPVAKAVTDYFDYWESDLVPTTSGPTHTIGGVPDWANRVELMLDRPEINTNDLLIVRLGTAGGIVSSGYTTSSQTENIGGSTDATGFVIVTGLANTRGPLGRMTFIRMDANIWLCDAALGLRATAAPALVAGRVDLGAVLTQVRLTRTGATANFNAGAIRARAYRN